MTLSSSEIDGVWEMLRAEFEGELAPNLVVANTTLEFARGEYRARFRGIITDSGRFSLGTAHGEKSLLFEGLCGSNIGRSIPCLYQLAGDRLRVCFGLDGSLPLKFSAQSGESMYLAVYRRGDATSNART